MKYLLLFALSSLAIGAQAFIITQDDFESLSVGALNNRNGWESIDYFPVEEGPKVRSAMAGITPLSGSKMLEVPNYYTGAGGGAKSVTKNDLFERPEPAAICDVSFAISESTYVKQEVQFQVAMFSYQSIFCEYSPVTGTWRFGGKSIQKKISFIDWNRLSIRIDWVSKKTALSLNGVELLQGSLQPVGGTNIRRITKFYLTTFNASNLTGYDPFTGSPGFFYDDYRVSAVPEPISIITFGAGALVLIRRRK